MKWGDQDTRHCCISALLKVFSDSSLEEETTILDYFENNYTTLR